MYNKSYAKISTLRPQFQKETGGKKKEKSIMVSSSKKGNCTRAFHAYFFRNTVQDGAGIPSILTIPPREIKSSIFPGSVSRLCLWKQTTTTPRIYETVAKACMHAYTHVRSLFPSKRTRRNGMRNGRIMRHIARTHTLPLCAHPRVSAPLEKLSLHRREELFRLWNNWLFSLSLSFLSSFFFLFSSPVRRWRCIALILA